MTATPGFRHDLFLCHASEDKDEVARPLAEALRERSWKVWFDEFELTMGDVLSREIDKGLAGARFGIVLLSPSFFAKKWPERELDGLTVRELNDGEKVILPVWHRVDAKYVSRYSPPLAGRLAPSTEDGIEEIVREIEGALRKAGVAMPGGGPARVALSDTVKGGNGFAKGARRVTRAREPRLSPKPLRRDGASGKGHPPNREIAARISVTLGAALIATLLLIIILRALGT